MTNIITNTRDRLNKRMSYQRTLHELRSLPLDVKLDLDIAGIEEKVAYRAVYGH